MPPLNNSGKSPQTAQEYAADRAKARFFCEVKSRLNAIETLLETDCLNAAHDAVVLLSQSFLEESRRRLAERHRQLEIEGLLTPSDRAAVNQAEFGLTR